MLDEKLKKSSLLIHNLVKCIAIQTRKKQKQKER